mmetsp:Transcript_45012/g.73349  ORF Transcript_45012/g.73349 Transcript_45012/m.73349 type:complete len:662 (+) Transcript_45012:157-2142(+)
MMSSCPDTLVATSQVTRFHIAETSSSQKDVDLKQVSISIGDLELLVDAELRLFSGVHYGLVGRNGVGKSSLLKSIAYGLLIGFPKAVRVLYVEQLDGIDPGIPVLSVILNSDKEALKLKRDAELLTKATESGSPQLAAMALRKLRMVSLKDTLEEAQKEAELRSGARGVAARATLVQAEAAVAEEGKREPPTKQEVAEALSVAHDLLSDTISKLQLIDSDSAESRARRILKGLGFSLKTQDAPIGQLSGGWKMRVSLAQALFLKPDILFLDEPTNHLDLPAILWLQKYLSSLDSTTLVIVSHDRSFLNAVTEETIVLRHKKLTYFTGNYDEYVSNSEDARQFAMRMKESLDRKRAHIEKSIQSGLKQAKKSGDDKKLSMVASRRKKLERVGLERNDKGHRFKLNRDRAGYHNATRDQVEVDNGDPSLKWQLPEPSELRYQGPLLQVEGVAFWYVKGGKRVLNNVTLNIEQGTRIGLVGANGDGKTTLMKLIEGELSPCEGSISRHPQARFGSFSQHFVDELYNSTDSNATPLSILSSRSPGVKEGELRGHLSNFGLGGTLSTQKLRTLSGGQMARVAMACATYPPPQLLLLDEPTNHLDIDTIECMVEALVSFEGAVIFVSHDQFFVDSVAEEVYCMVKGNLSRLEDGVEEYIQKISGKSS